MNNYSNYLSDNLDTTKYTEYCSEHLTTNVDYCDYLTDYTLTNIAYAEYVAERVGGFKFKSKQQIQKEERIKKLNKLNVIYDSKR